MRATGALACLAATTLSLLAGGCPAARASAAPSVGVRATLAPEVLGHSTTVRVSVRLLAGDEPVPPPLVEGELRYPAGLDVQLSGLGIDPCHVAALELFGLAACPPNSVMGYGSATAQLLIKREVVSESARIAVVRTDEQAGHPAALFYIYGETALSAQIVLMVEMLTAVRPYGGLLRVHVPLIPTFFEGPDVSVVEMSLVLGPKNLTYYERIHHKLLRYRPAGIPLPGRCPPGGFPFAVRLRLLDGREVSATTAVPCPLAARGRRR